MRLLFSLLLNETLLLLTFDRSTASPSPCHLDSFFTVHRIACFILIIVYFDILDM